MLAALAIEGLLRIFMPSWRDYDSNRFIHPVSVQGFGEVNAGTPGFDGYFAQKDGDFRVRVSINGFGLRNQEPVESADLRIWIIGDSVTFGWGVEEDEIYSSAAARLSGKPTYNISSPGTDVCGYQALLARMPGALRPQALIVGLLLENDVGFYEGCQARAKKAEAAKGGASSGVKPPKPFFLALKIALTRHSALYNFLAVSIKRLDILISFLTKIGVISEAHLSTAAFSESDVKIMIEKTMPELERLRSILPSGVPVAILIVPSRFEISNGSPIFNMMRLALGEELAARGFGVIDPFLRFKEAGLLNAHFAHDGHWSKLGHEIAGKAVAEWVNANLN